MSLFSFHLAKTSLITTAAALWRPPTGKTVPGLNHAECLARMTLGSPIFSPARLRFGELAMFARWDSEPAIDAFLANTKLGQTFATGWHVRLAFQRRWGHVAAVGELPAQVGDQDPNAPVVAFTLARMKLPQVPRFIRWGRPVETLVRDHPATTFAMAAMRLPRTICTFSIWRTLREMEDMVHGRSPVPDPTRHSVAMAERQRKDFHFEFTTLRFRPLSEHGEWEGRRAMVPAR